MRYEDCDESLVEKFIQVIEDRFPQYAHLKIKLIFDTKKRIKDNKIVLASIEKANDKLRFFSRDNIAIEGYDYVLVVDRKAWELSSDKDRTRVISHELRHVLIDEKDRLKLTGHEINDFFMEVKLNEDDPEWARKLARLTDDVYAQEKDDKE
jgi:hypothetical protein